MQTLISENTNIAMCTYSDYMSKSFWKSYSGDVRGWKTTVSVSHIEVTASIRHAMPPSTCANALVSRTRHDVHVSMLSSHGLTAFSTLGS
jgi:hypothetical protein